MRRTRSCSVLSVLCLLGGYVAADVDTDPYLFSHQSIDPTGQFEWDEFEGSHNGPHAADVASTGVGSSELVVTGELNPGDGPPFGVLTSTGNLYSGGTFGTYSFSVSEAATTEAYTSIVLQIAALGSLDTSTFLLDDMEPVEMVDRGIRFDVVHDADTKMSEFDTRYYWAEWQVEPKADYELSVTGAHTHLSFAAARVDYFQTPELFDAAAPESVFIPKVDPDFDGSGEIDVNDLDMLCTAVAANSETPNLDFDLSDNEELTTQDVALFLQLAGSLTGDADLNGSVTFPDFLALSAGFGAEGSWSSGDFDCNGTVEFPDFLALSAEFGNGTAAAASVPEPNGLSMLLFAAVGMLIQRRSSTRKQ